MSPVHKDKSRAFSNSIRRHPRVDEYWPTRDDKSTCVWAVNDHALITRRATAAKGKDVLKTLSKRGITVKQPTTLFTPLKDRDHPSGEDVGVWRLTAKGGKALPRGTVFDAIHELWTGPLRDFVRDVSPNHVLVPAANGDSCPHGPPLGLMFKDLE